MLLHFQQGTYMKRIIEINSKPIILHDVEAVRLVKQRAIREKRSASNAFVLVQRELDKSTSLLRDCLAFGKEVFLGIARR